MGLVVGWGLLVVGWRGFLVGPRPNGPPRKLAYAGLLVAALMLPMLSNDVFSVFAYGSIAAQGRDVYTTASGLSDTVWYPWVGQHWSQKVCVYGPSTLVGALPVALGGHSPWLSLALLRVAWLAPLAAVMELSFRRLRDRPLFHAMVWLNPLWLVEGPGQMHADLLGVTAVVAGIALHDRRKARERVAALRRRAARQVQLRVHGPLVLALRGAHDARAPRANPADRGHRASGGRRALRAVLARNRDPHRAGSRARRHEPGRLHHRGRRHPRGARDGRRRSAPDAPVQAALELRAARFSATTWLVASLRCGS